MVVQKKIKGSKNGQFKLFYIFGNSAIDTEEFVYKWKIAWLRFSLYF